MSTLSNNLQQIYTIKNQIKEVIGTTSDVFADYPQIIYNLLHSSSDSYIECADYAALLACNVDDKVTMTNAVTVDNSECIGTVDASFAQELGTATGVDLTSYIGKLYCMFSDADGMSSGEVYGILIDTSDLAAGEGLPTGSNETTEFLFEGELAWKNASAGTGNFSSLVIGENFSL